jgi:hypothetical protein
MFVQIAGGAMAGYIQRPSTTILLGFKNCHLFFRFFFLRFRSAVRASSATEKQFSQIKEKYMEL